MSPNHHMSFPKLPDAELARRQSSLVRAERERAQLEAEERARQERREKRKKLRQERERRLEINKERNQWIRSAIQLAAHGKFFLAVGEIDNDVKHALEQLGFYIGSKQELLEEIRTTDLYEFWDENSLPTPDCSHCLPSIEEILRASIYEGFGYYNVIEEKQIERVIRTVLGEYYQDVLEGRLDHLVSKLHSLSQWRYCDEPIHHSELIFDKIKREAFKRSRIGKLLEEVPLNLYVFSLRNIALSMIAEIEKVANKYRKLANYITTEVEKDLQQNRTRQILMSWYRFPYVSQLGTYRFSEALFWLACEEGQETNLQVNKAITAAIEDGLFEVEVPLGPTVNNIKLASVLKHFLRGKGYKVDAEETIDMNFRLKISWDFNLP